MTQSQLNTLIDYIKLNPRQLLFFCKGWPLSLNDKDWMLLPFDVFIPLQEYMFEEGWIYEVIDETEFSAKIKIRNIC